jgi:hypothetical protein
VHDLRHTCASLMIREGASIKAVQHHLGHKSASITLDRYGHLFPEELDHLAERLDRLHAEAGVYPACTGAPLAALGHGKGLVGDQARWWRWGDSNSTSPISSIRGQDAIGSLTCGMPERLVTAPARCCPWFARRVRTQRGPNERFRPSDAARRSSPLRRGIGSVG